MPYSEAFKARMVRTMAGPNGRSATSLAPEVGVSQNTLSRWLREAGTVGSMGRPKPKSRPKKSKPPEPTRRPKDWTAEEKHAAVIEASQLSEDELGAFLRRKGLHQADLDRWRSASIEALGQPSRREKKEANRQANQVKKLERELRRKEKALAEAAALLVLQKKLNTFYGDEGDDT